MIYEIEADWQLLNTCNYRCGYCFFPPNILSEKLRAQATPIEWQSAYDGSGYTWLLHITGGEPSVYPGLAELCERLTRRHFISVNSNLSGSFQDFAERVDPSRVSFINAGFHLEERERRSGMAAFLRNADLLRSRGFRVLPSVVATASALARFQDAADILAKIDLVPIPKVLRGPYEGQKFPEAYSELDKTRFRKFAALAREFYEPLLLGAAERPSIDMFRDDELLDGEPSFAGRSCEAGHKFVRIDPAGEVFRCGAPAPLGNILDGTFKRQTGQKPCDTRFCIYYCWKYAKEETAPAIGSIVSPRLNWRGVLGASKLI